MANDFVRNIKGVRNIGILSRNITTENDLISTTDGEVYVVTNKGYRKITGVETKEIKQLKTDVSNVKIQSDTNTLNISNLTDDIETNTSDISELKTTTETNTSDIADLKTTTETNTSDIADLKTTTGNNTTDIGTLQTSTDNNTTEIDSLKNKIKEIETNINVLNKYNKVNTLRDIDLMDINSLNNVPLGVNYVLNSFNKPEEMKDDTGWLTVHSNNSIKRLMFQPYNEPRVYYNRIYNNSLGVWE